MPALTRDEAKGRALVVQVTSYDVDLDLDQGPVTFVSTTRVRFSCTDPGAQTFLDVVPLSVDWVRLNGAPVDAGAIVDGRLPLTGLQADNLLECRATMAYSHDGQGLQRTVDPADGEAYVVASCFLDAAPRVFACFDQPDLKAPYTVSVRTQPGWVVLGNGTATERSPGQWVLSTTPPLATYFVTVCAGPWVSVRTEHDGIPIGLHTKRSLRGELERWQDEILSVTTSGLDYYHRLFGSRYAFGDYDVVFAPELNTGAMENAGCVTVRDDYLFRGVVPDDDRLQRAMLLAHELAHMWFGDLVTMQWWDDLWLNESFAEYLATRTLVETTEHTDAWTWTALVRKTWGYSAERLPSAHPVAGADTPDTLAALHNFDGISYAKGAAVLRQLAVYVGDEAFVRGLDRYLDQRAFGNGTLADLVEALEEVSGLDLAGWCRAWLQSVGCDRVSAALTADDPGRLEITRQEPGGAGSSVQRPHALDVAGWSGGVEQFRVDVVARGDRSVFGDRPLRPAAVVVPNASDLTWAQVDLAPEVVAAMPGELSAIPDATARAVVWSSLYAMVSQSRMDPREFLQLVLRAWASEPSPVILRHVAAMVTGRFGCEFLMAGERDGAADLLADAAWRVLDGTRPQGSRAVVAAQVLVPCTNDEWQLAEWLAGRDVPAGLSGDRELTWLVAQTMARRGFVDERVILDLSADDPSARGRVAALRARASLPTVGAKAWAWDQLAGHLPGRSLPELVAVLQGLWSGLDDPLVVPYVERYFGQLQVWASRLGPDALGRIVRTGFPRAPQQATLDLAYVTAAQVGSSTVRLAILDGASELAEAVRSLRRYGLATGS